jgi:hypothetical protein
VKIAKIESVFFNLPEVFRVELLCTDFAFHDHDSGSRQDDHVYAASESIQWILQEHRPARGSGTEFY